MYLLTFSTATRPWTRCTSSGCKTHSTENNYVEGCWLRTHDEPLPGLITGLEDGLDSQFGFSINNYPQVQKASPTGLNRECNANFTVCKKQGLQFQTANTGMLTFLSDYTQSHTQTRQSRNSPSAASSMTKSLLLTMAGRLAGITVRLAPVRRQRQILPLAMVGNAGTQGWEGNTARVVLAAGPARLPCAATLGTSSGRTRALQRLRDSKHSGDGTLSPTACDSKFIRIKFMF